MSDVVGQALQLSERSKTVFGPVLDRSVRRPDEPAFWFLSKGAARTVTNLELITGARRYGAALKRAGVGRGDIVLLLLDHSVDQYFGFLGAMLLGAVPSFMPPLSSKQIPELYWAAHAALFDRIRPRALVIDAARVQQLEACIPTRGFTVVTPDVAAAASPEHCPSPVDAHPADLALLQHSSGTTKLKKGVQLSHRAILAQVEAYQERLQLGAHDRIASWLPLYHDMGLIACFITPLVLGIPVAALDPFEWVVAPDLLLRAIAEYRCTLAWLPNFAFHHLVRTRRPDSRHDLSSIRAWIDCSEPCRAETFDLFASTFRESGVTPDRLQVCYAMAETVFAVSQTRQGEPVRRLRVDPGSLRSEQRIAVRGAGEEGLELLSAGRVLPGLDVRILDSNGTALPAGAVGEIAISGEFLFSGYYRLPEETARKMQDGVYRTNDQGFLWGDELYVLGRLDDLIIVNGRNFYCHEVEHLVSSIPGVRAGRVAAFGVPDTVAGTQAAVVVAECDESQGGRAAALKRRIKEAVLSQCDLTLREAALVPPGWVVKTTSGKVSRLENRAKYLSGGTRKGAA